MTNREAVARIKDHIEVHHIKEDRAIKIVQALNMAIKALERTEWHYPSKGEYPPDGQTVLCLERNYVVSYLGVYHDGEWYDGGMKNGCGCWQYIVPPKEEA